jgi:hypothetical protein
VVFATGAFYRQTKPMPVAKTTGGTFAFSLYLGPLK